VAVDIETKDPHLKKYGIGVRRGGYIIGVSFAIEDGPAYYLPIRHDGGDNLDEAAVLSYLQDNCKAFRGEIVGANFSYDADYLAEANIIFRNATIRDVQIADPLLYELHRSYSLDNIAQRWEIEGKDEGLLKQAAAYYGVEAKSGMYALPGRYVGAYAEQDVRLPLKLLRRQEAQIDREGLREVYDLECALLPVLVKMRRRGVKINLDKTHDVATWTLQKEQAAWDEVHRHTGIRLTPDDTNTTAALARVLKHLGIDLPKTEKSGADSVTTAVLKEVDHPVGDLIREAKRFNRLRTYAVARDEHAVKGRIHATFNQLRAERETGDTSGAAYGRMSSSSPNIQQEPKDPQWRCVYEPDNDRTWACIDLKSQEPRWLVHFAERMGFQGAGEMADQFRSRPDSDPYAIAGEVTGQERDTAKQIMLAYTYGMGAGKLARELGLPYERVPHFKDKNKTMLVGGEEAQAMLANFDEKLPFLKRMKWECRERAERRGYIMTALKRKCRFPKSYDGRDYDFTYKALNRLVQGSSGDQIKAGLVAADKAGFPIQITVHDEIDFSAESADQARELAEIVREALPCSVPAATDIEMGPNWGELEGV
jgi:DNA polymerase I-like protein with 3'-5' exonuclease and polymerase domains